MIHDPYVDMREYFDTCKYMIHNEIWHDSNCKSKYNLMRVTLTASYLRRVDQENKDD